ncbi:MAG: hypothetical protein IPL53_13965 [Ignavibacteria bacterium]|nr:hypothetical protein [Ignavibacteria bacterium]
MNIRDSAVFYLRNISPPYSLVDSGKSVIDSMSASGTVTFANAASGTYYIVVKGRNLLETWSRAGGESFVRGTPFSYNFTNSQTKAYDNNLILVGERYCIYNGDVIENYAIDLNDILQINNAAGAFVTGFNVNDLTGNRIVDLSDVLIAFNNSSNFVVRKSPPGSGPVSAVYESRFQQEQRIKEINESLVKEEALPEVNADEIRSDQKKILNK